MPGGDRERILKHRLNVMAVERMKYIYSHVNFREIAKRGYNIEFEKVIFTQTKESEFGLIWFKYFDGRVGKVVSRSAPAELYFESCLAVEMDPRMRLGLYETEDDIDEAWMDGKLRRGRLEEEPYRYDPKKYCGTRGSMNGYAVAENGAYRNLKRWDGSYVLADWYHNIHLEEDGFIIVGMTKRRTRTTPTQYLEGIAHTSGIVLFPVIFNSVRRLENGGPGFYAEYEGSPYILKLDGGIYDCKRRHLPQKVRSDRNDFLEKILNWTLSGLQFYFRDTDAPVVVGATYHPGDIIRAGFFIDVTTKLLRPVGRTRFLIASAHAARFFEVEDLVRNNPKVGQWNLCVLDFNSYFKVMDVYERDGFTQVFLLHIPSAAVCFLGGNVTVNFKGEGSLVDTARHNFDEKLTMDVHPRSRDSELVDRMHHPVGLDKDYRPMELEPVILPADSDAAGLSAGVRRLAREAEAGELLGIDDNFIFRGVARSVCEGCMYAGGIVGNGRGCGRLLTDYFRDRYIKGRCEFHKTRLGEPSEFERRKKEEALKAKEVEEKTTDAFALRTLRAFIRKHLGGNVYRLRDFDFSIISEDEEFGSHDISRSAAVRSIMALAFGQSWPDLNLYNIENYTFLCGKINDPQRLIGHLTHEGQFFELSKFNPPELLHRRCLNACRLTGTIGNIMVLPDKGSFFSHLNSYRLRGMIDRFLMSLYGTMTWTGKPDLDMKAILYNNRRLMPGFEGEAGFRKFIDSTLLGDYVGYDFRPRELFANVWPSKKGLESAEYFEAVTRFCRVCEQFIPKRSDMIIDRLVRKLEL